MLEQERERHGFSRAVSDPDKAPLGAERNLDICEDSQVLFILLIR